MFWKKLANGQSNEQVIKIFKKTLIDEDKNIKRGGKIANRIWLKVGPVMGPVEKVEKGSTQKHRKEPKRRK